MRGEVSIFRQPGSRTIAFGPTTQIALQFAAGRFHQTVRQPSAHLATDVSQGQKQPAGMGTH